jgi:uncharacterized protein
MVSKLFLFYIIAIALTAILAIGQQKLKIDFESIVMPQLAPTIAFLITLSIFSTLKTPLNFHVGKNVLMKAMLASSIPIGLFSIGFYLSKAVGVKVELTNNLVNILPMALGGMIIGAIGEEIGWRGFLQPNLEKIYSIILSSIIIGLFWGLWHIGHYKNGVLFMFGFLLFTVSASIVLRGLLEGTDNNLILSILFHLSINIGFFVFYKNAMTDSKMILVNGVIWAIPAMIIGIMLYNIQIK